MTSAREGGRVVSGRAMPWWYASELDGVKRLGEQHTQALARVEATLCGLQRRLNIVQEKCESNDAFCKERIARVEEAHARKVTPCTEMKEGLDAVTAHVAEVASGLESLAGCFVEVEELLKEAKCGKPHRRLHLPHMERAKSKLQPGAAHSFKKSRGMWEQGGPAVTSSEKTKVHRRCSLKESTTTQTGGLAVHSGDGGHVDTPRGTPGRVGTAGGSPSSCTRNPDSDGCTDTSPQDAKQTWADMSSGSAQKIDGHVPCSNAESLGPPESSIAECKADNKSNASSRSSSRTLSPPVMIEEFTFCAKPSLDLSTGSGKGSEPKQEDFQVEPPGSCVIWMPSRGAGDAGNSMQESCQPHGQGESPKASGENTKSSGATGTIPQRVASTPESLAETAQELTRREASPSITHTEIPREHPRQEVWRKVRPSKQQSSAQIRRTCGHSSGGVAATVPPAGHWVVSTSQPQQPRQAGISRTHVYGQQRRLVSQRHEDVGAGRKSKAPVLRMRSMPALGTVSTNGRIVVR